MNKAFGVSLGEYRSDSETYRGREGHIYVPNEIADIVEGIFGLDNRKVVRRSASIPMTGGGGTSALTPAQVAKLYNFPTGIDASHETIGILEFGGGYHISDVNAFFSGQSLIPPSVVSVGVDGAANTPGGGADIEVILDIDVAGSTAQGAKIAVYFAPNTEAGFHDAVIAAIHDPIHRPSVLSISWGGLEGYAFTAAAMFAINMAFLEAAALGKTVFASSGDYGSEIFGGKPNVNYPASDPWVTACGGTSISNVSGSFFNENTWPGTGGGVSVVFPLQIWQLGAGVPGNGRGLPDVAGNADPSSGYVLIYHGLNFGPVGGTSAVAPLYAGLIALINASLGHRVGYLNPTLYKLHGAPYFRDINDNISNGTYKSGPGWDACTGWGSPHGVRLLNALRPKRHWDDGIRHTGLVSEVFYDCFGYFEGFMLDTCGDRHHYKCRERGINEIVLMACKDRMLISVFAEEREHKKIQKIIVQA
jgi:kumamolisin